jgi:hypothetical protein
MDRPLRPLPAWVLAAPLLTSPPLSTQIMIRVPTDQATVQAAINFAMLA